MGDIMRPIPFGRLLDWVITEYADRKSIFGVRKIVRYEGEPRFEIFGEKLESPYGPAAGPNTQLAQNIIASYAAGARFFELKTVQKMDGRELAACVPKPCINASDECYNCEWSTELTVEEAFDEYVKAFFACRVLAAEYGLGDPDGFVFNMSVGYDLDGIKTEKINNFLEGMKDASETPVFKECVSEIRKAAEAGRFSKIDAGFADNTPHRVSGSVTESTLHGCPPDEIERIASYLLTEKGLHTFIKCNPTLLGYDYARKTLDGLGFDYIAFDDHHFLEDLQWKDAVPMFERLMEMSASLGLEFGVKLTNTFPVDVKAGELPSEEMYMSGRSLFPLTMTLASRIADEFKGKLRISYSGGADFFSIGSIASSGIWPITMATTILKPGGYERMSQMADLFGKMPGKFESVDGAAVSKILEDALGGPVYRKPIKPVPSRKMPEELPLLDCFTAPCRTSCPIEQDIPAYLNAMEQGRSEDALKIILDRNALPFMTGTLCPSTCRERCVRNHYEDGLYVRDVKLRAATEAYESVLKEMRPAATISGGKTAVVGGGPAGIAAAYFLARAGVPVTVFERSEKPGGVPARVIPSFRISAETIAKDVSFAGAYGAEFVTGREIASADELFKEGFENVIAAIGAWRESGSFLEYGEAVDALDFLMEVKADPDKNDYGKNIAVIGAGNTAMDVARAAKRLPGVENVRIVYRRTAKYMPADEEELVMAREEGIEFCELLSPVGVKDGLLSCRVCALGEPDASGRRSSVVTSEEVTVPADTVIGALGEKIDTSFYEASGAALDDRGKPLCGEDLMTSVKGLYAAGDCRRGPATIVKAIADASKAAESIVRSMGAEMAAHASSEINASLDREALMAKKGIIRTEVKCPDDRCLGCSSLCGLCADVCPNRANIIVDVPGSSMPQILHVDGMCNECGNCAIFCPYSGRPYRDKTTVFGSLEDFEDSGNPGFLVTDLNKGIVRVRLGGRSADYEIRDEKCGLYEPLRRLIVKVMDDMPYLL